MLKRLCLLILVTGVPVGCASGPFARPPSLPKYTQGQPTAEELINHLNANARSVQSIECTRVDIQAKQGNQSLGVDAMLAFQKPRNFRLMAQAVGTTQADMGSNDQEFWFWIKNAQPPGLRYCSYEDLPRCQALPLPIHPDWIAEALCVTEFGDPREYKVEENRGAFHLTTETTTPQGQRMQKITVIDRNTGLIAAHHLMASNGQAVWSAYIEKYHTNLPGHTVPRKVRLVCPSQNVEMKLDLNGCKVNTLAPGRTSPELFARPQNYQAIDLAGGVRATPQSYHRGTY